MARSDGSAYDAACREAHAIVEGVIASILEGIKAGEVDEDTLSDRIHEECDNALIYTSDQWVCAYGLRDDEDAIESANGCEPTTFLDALCTQAFLNLRSAVSGHDFSDAFAVAEDAAEETTPEEPRDEVTP
jgi:hypothetical protein